MSSDPRTLVGEWTLARRVVDRMTGQHGTVRGGLVITPDLRWCERGTLEWDGARLAVTRELVFRRDGAGWAVHFADGGFFHAWTPGRVVGHPCRADVYRGLIDVRAETMRVWWDVSGPAKSQRLFTRLKRGRAGSAEQGQA